MVKISEKLKKNKIKIAIGVIILIIIIGGVFFTKGYQKQYENPPMLYIENEDGTKQAMLPISYEWEYKGQTKKYDIENYVVLLDEPGVDLHVNAQKEILNLF